MGGGSSSDRRIEVYRLLRFPRETNRPLLSSNPRVCIRTYICNTFHKRTHPAFTLAERTIRCFPLTGRNHLWQSPANDSISLDIGPASRDLEIGQHAARVVRETGPNSSCRPRDLKGPFVTFEAAADVSVCP